MARIEFVDQSLRDGQQSLWGMRMRAGHVLPVAEAIDTTGYRIVDLTGSSMFEVQVRYNRENPWRGLDTVRAAFKHSVLRAGTRTNGIVGFAITPDSIVKLWIETLAKHGIQSLWIYDCLHDVDKMLEVAKVAKDAGLAAAPQINFSSSPVHTDDYYAKVMDRFAASDIPDTIILGDEAGVLGPERARSWIRLMKERSQGKVLEMHFHNRTAMAPLNHAIGVEEGVTILHTAASSMANGPSMPSIEVAVDNMRRLGHEVALDNSRLGEVSEHLGALADELGYKRGEPVEYAMANIQQQFPGGMMGTFRAQLVQYGMEERLPEVLEEAIRVRAELGWPIMATPFSQIVGIQALLNVVQGERYVTVPDENLMYLAGHYGPPPGELDQDLLDRVFSTERGKRMLAWSPPHPSLKEIRKEYGMRLSDEELLLRYLIPKPDVDAMYEVDPPIVPIVPARRRDGLGWISSALTTPGPRELTASDGHVTIELRR